MFPQLQQVALNYATRRSLWLMAAFAAFFAGPGLLVALFNAKAAPQSEPFMLFAVGFGAGIVGWVLLTQAKWQFCDPRARLLPGFARPHLAILAAIGLLGFAAFPIVVALFSRNAPLGIAACGIGLGACYIWSMHRPNGLVTAIALVQFFSLMFPRTLVFWTSSRFATYHVAILIVGWAAFAAWLARLVVMREENSDYNLPIQAQQGSATRLERTSGNRNISRLMLRSVWQRFICDWWHDRIAHFRVATTRGRQRLLNYGFMPAPIWVSAAPMAISFLVILWAMSKFGVMSAKGPNESMLPAMNVMFLMPAIFGGQFLAMRRSRMAQEVLFPLTRKQYFDGLLTAIARMALISGTTILAVAFLLLQLTSPEMLVPCFIVELVALIAAVQVFCFGVLARLSQIDSGGKRLAASMAMIIVATIPLFSGMTLLGHPGVTYEQLEASFRQDSASTLQAIDAVNGTKEMRDQIEANIHNNAQSRFDHMQPAHPAWIAAIVIPTAAIGAALTLYGRNRWLTVELG